MITGRVKWFSDHRGYGFLETDDIKDDIFVHFSEIQSEGFRTLVEGQTVLFELLQGDKGYQAKNVAVCEDEPAGFFNAQTTTVEEKETEELAA